MFSMPDAAVILAVAIVVFGPKKLPDIARSLGKGIREFKDAAEEDRNRETRMLDNQEDPDRKRGPSEEDKTNLR